MSRLIDADMLTEVLKSNGLKDSLVYMFINQEPTVDAKPVIHGEWIGLEYDGYADGNPVYDLWECSHCNCEWDGEEDTLPSYCPDCGAEMEVFNLVRENYHKVNEDYIQEQIKAATDYLDCHYCKHKSDDGLIWIKCLSCMRNYGIYTQKDNEDMADEYGWPKLDLFEIIENE